MAKHWHHSIRLQQASDTQALKDDIQTLEIKIEPTEDDSYVVLKTKRWAFNVDELDEFVAYLKQLCQSADQAVDEALSSTEFPRCEAFRLEAKQ